MLSNEKARRNMIDGQLRPNNVTDDRVLATMESVPREGFVPQRNSALANSDVTIDLGGGRWLLAPMVFAQMVQALEITPDDRILEVATASGYGAAILARLGTAVVAVEDSLELASNAASNMQRLQLHNVDVVTSPLTLGYVTQAPYDVIVVNGGAVHDVPDSLLAQLAEGGRLVAIRMGRDKLTGQACLWRRVGGTVSVMPLFGAVAPVLDAFNHRPRFVL